MYTSNCCSLDSHLKASTPNPSPDTPRSPTVVFSGEGAPPFQPPRPDAPASPSTSSPATNLLALFSMHSELDRVRGGPQSGLQASRSSFAHSRSVASLAWNQRQDPREEGRALCDLPPLPFRPLLLPPAHQAARGQALAFAAPLARGSPATSGIPWAHLAFSSVLCSDVYSARPSLPSPPTLPDSALSFSSSDHVSHHGSRLSPLTGVQAAQARASSVPSQRRDPAFGVLPSTQWGLVNLLGGRFRKQFS